MRELYIPVEPGLYAPTATDVIFNILVAIAFFGKGTMRRLVESMPMSIRENPIYIRHTSRFRGFLAGYFEPSGKFKSGILLRAWGAFFLFVCFFLPALSVPMLIPVFGFVLAALVPFDAYVKLARMHRERLAWESVIITPLPGRAMIEGTFGVLLTHRLLPLLPGMIYVILFQLIGRMYLSEILASWFLVISVYFAGLSLAASIAWLVPNARLAGAMLSAWVATLCLSIVIVLYEIYPIPVFTHLDDKSLLLFMGLGLVMIMLGLLSPALFGNIFDRIARVPFPTRPEEE